jgi:hypothetical protein
MRLSGGAWAGALAAVCLVWVCILFDANSRRVGESHWRKVLVAEGDLRSKDWRGSDAEYVHLIREAEKAAGHQPQNIQYRHWLSAYRWYSLERAADPNTRQVKISPEMLSFAERIVGELNLARTVCPTFGATWSFLGQLERSILGQDESGSRHIRVGRRLAPCDPITCLVAGTLDAEEGGRRSRLQQLEPRGDAGRTTIRAGGVPVRHAPGAAGPRSGSGRGEAKQGDLACELSGDDIGGLRNPGDNRPQNPGTPGGEM